MLMRSRNGLLCVDGAGNVINGVNGDTLDPSYFSRGDTISVDATHNDGFDDGAVVSASIWNGSQYGSDYAWCHNSPAERSKAMVLVYDFGLLQMLMAIQSRTRFHGCSKGFLFGYNADDNRTRG